MFVQLKEFPQYAVTDCGEVINLQRGGRALSPSKSANGYMKVNLCRDGRVFTKAVHRLVADAFMGPSTLQVNHKDCDKANNHLSNLEYCTPAENSKHAWENGLMEPAREATVAYQRAIKQRKRA